MIILILSVSAAQNLMILFKNVSQIPMLLVKIINFQ